jgi:hypothetical protein
MTLIAGVHDPNARQIGEDHSTGGNPAAGLVDVGDSRGPDARNRDDRGDLSRAAIRILGSCDDFGRLDMSWLYAPDAGDNTLECRPAILTLEEVMEAGSLPLGLAVS